MFAAGSLVCERTGRITFLVCVVTLFLGCRSPETPQDNAPETASRLDAVVEAPGPEEAFLRRFIALVRARQSLEDYQAMWHVDVRHHIDIELLYRRYPKQLQEQVRRIEAALDAGVPIEYEAVEPTDRGNARRMLRYRCINRALEERDCTLRMLTDFDGQWFLHDID